ncbi:MAG: AEC family transporter [Verrucomicrobiales bacterium]
MVSYATLLGATLPVFLIMAAGFGLRRSGALHPAGDATLITLMVNITYPCFILSAVMVSPALREPGNVLPPVFWGAALVLAGLLIGWLVAPVCGLRRGNGRRTFALATSVQNYGYLPIPLMEAIMPDSSWMGVVFVYTLGVELAIWSVGVMMLSGNWRQGLRQVLNPIVGSIVIGVILNFLRLDAYYPAWLFRFLGMMGDCAFPLGILVSGATLCDLLRQPGALADWKTPIGAIALRLALLPAMMVAVAHWVPMTPTLREVLAVQAAMPAAVFPIIIARRYGGHEPTAVRVLVFTTLVSFFTIPVTLAFALRAVHP